MTISFSCPSCNTMRRAATALAGRQVRCPACDAIVEVPLETEQEFSDAPEDEPDAEDLIVIEMVAAAPLPGSAPVPGGYPPLVAGVAQPKPAVPPESDEVVFNSQQKMNRDDTEMDMTPMVDVVFQLLIFFMLTAAFALQKAKEVPKPEEKTDQPSQNVVVQEDSDNPDLVTVKIDSLNTYRVITVDWDEEAPTEHEMFVKLRRAKQGDSAGRIPNKMMIQIHEEAFQDKLIAALDGATSVEINDIQIMTVSVDE